MSQADDEFDSPESNQPLAAPLLPTVPFWKAHTTKGRPAEGAIAGRPRLFDTPEELLEACMEYIQWVEDHPLYEAQPFHYQGSIVIQNMPKMRAMTIAGLCLFLQISRNTWYEWKKSRRDLQDIIAHVEDAIIQQKITGAAADLLNANIIAREVGLADTTKVKAEVEQKSDLSNLDDAELAQVQSILLAAAQRKGEA